MGNVKYQNVRGKIRSGDAMFVRGIWPFSRFIQHFTGQSWSHVGTFWRCGHRLFVIEAIEGVGVRINLASKATPFYWVPTNIKWTDELEQFALDRIGEPYSLWDCFYAGMNLPTRKSGWQCAELFKAIADKGMMPLKSNAIPGEIANELMKLGAPMRHVISL